jgi:ribonuclease Z
MSEPKEDKEATEATAKGCSRREALRLSALALGGLALGRGVVRADQQCTGAACPEPAKCYPDKIDDTQTYSYFNNLPNKYYPNDPTDPNIALQDGEMRITFLGSMVPPVRRAQAEMSIFVEVGPWVYDPKHMDPPDPTYGHAADSFVFDCGSGVCGNYGAMNIQYSRMNKIFLTHLHADHMSDLTHIFCFGPGGGRYSPLYVWGPGPSGVKNPKAPPKTYDDGTKAMCQHLREALRWCTESFAFQASAYEGYPKPSKKSWGLPCEPVPVGDDPADDGYALVPIELNWKKYGKKEGDNVAYDNPETGVKITHFPVIHCRKGSIGYKLEYKGLSMIFTGDTKPEVMSVNSAINGGNGVDVFIHEMGLPPELWAMKNMHLDKPASGPQWDATVNEMTTVINSSHSPFGAFGYLISQVNPKPRLTVATHFQSADDTVACAKNSILYHWPEMQWGQNFIISFDLMVLKVTQAAITQFQANVPAFGFSPLISTPANLKAPKYWTWGVDSNGNKVKVGDPYAQIDRSTQIPECDPVTHDCNYRDDGY